MESIYYPMMDEIIRFAFEKDAANFREFLEDMIGCGATLENALRQYGHDNSEYIEDYCGGI